MSPYNTAGLISEDSEEVTTQITKNCRRRSVCACVCVDVVFQQRIEGLSGKTAQRELCCSCM